ncbi:MAG: glycine cleavage system aminomethyltransferase GcvT [Candidatus Latescibacteria bacterium]|nr:glycine cleavage system aminomethyltransferase GcvT [Candidatus Latescibacterota bacterium]
MAEGELRRTPFFDLHRAAGAKMVPFSGWEMPVQYEGILAEHRCVRSAAGLFDVSHMGRVEVHGRDAVAFVNVLTTNDVERLEPGQAQYSAMCDARGGIVDDLLVYRRPDRILLVPNAGNRAKDLDWMVAHRAGFDVDIRDVSEETALLALQGPRAPDVLARLTSLPLDEIGYYRFRVGEVCGCEMVVSRTGYTGEDGFELWFPASEAARVWTALIDAGREFRIKPCGLGARDTLRLEMGYCLYGHEIDETTSVLEAGLGWITRFTKSRFIGKEALLAQKAAGLTRRLIGFRLRERGFPRQGYAILHDGQPVGTVASGTVSPSLDVGIGTGYVPVELAKPGTDLEIDVRGKRVPTDVVKLPFYTGGSGR